MMSMDISPNIGMQWLVGIVCLLIFAGASAMVPASAPVLSSDTEVATAGYYQLQWSWPESAEISHPTFELEAADSRDFFSSRIIYTGRDGARVISGEPDGELFYRVRALSDQQQAGPWSEVVRVSIEHHPLDRAFTLFFLGLIVFVSTVALLIYGSRHSASPH